MVILSTLYFLLSFRFIHFPNLSNTTLKQLVKYL
nr:MAG TPA: hypothetical protein [Caudoviricetes sp.]